MTILQVLMLLMLESRDHLMGKPQILGGRTTAPWTVSHSTQHENPVAGTKPIPNGSIDDDRMTTQSSMLVSWTVTCGGDLLAI